MKKQFVIAETSVLPDGRVLMVGTVFGPHLVNGERGRAVTPAGEIKVEIISIGLADSTRAKPDMQALQVRILEGDKSALKGSTLEFGEPDE